MHFLIPFLVAGAAATGASQQGRATSKAARVSPESTEVITITSDTTLPKGALLHSRIVVKANHITIDGNGATLIGPAKKDDIKSFEDAGAGIEANGCTDVTLKNVKAKGFASGLVLTDCKAWMVEGCDFSGNYDNRDFMWGELPSRGGVILDRVSYSIFRNNKANNVWDGVSLTNSNDNEFADNDFSHCSNVCARLWTSCRNKFLNNNLSYGLRIDVSTGEKHARDSTGILLEDASHDNYWYRNDITHGGDGIFIRALRTAKSSGNVFIENDTSYANNNCVESWCPGNTFIRNKANHGSYGFWLGGSDNTVLIGNEAGFNGQPDGFHNAQHPIVGSAGIIFFGGSGSNSIIEGNYLHDNAGAGIAFQGSTRSRRRTFKIYHWIIQNNRIEKNRQAIYAENADWIFLGPNTIKGNAGPDSVKNVTRLINGAPDPSITRAPVVILTAPERVKVGESVTLDASKSYDPQEKPLIFQWDVDGAPTEGATVTRAFDKPGTYRIAITVSNGTLAGLGFKDIVVE